MRIHKLKALRDQALRADFLSGTHSSAAPITDGDAQLITRYIREPSYHRWVVIKDIEVLPGLTLTDVYRRVKTEASSRHPLGDELGLAIIEMVDSYNLAIDGEFSKVVKGKFEAKNSDGAKPLLKLVIKND